MTRLRNHLPLLALGGIVAVGATACNIDINLGTEGSGVAETVIYDFDSFDEIELGGAFDATITIVDGPPTVEVTVDDNLVDDLDVKVRDGRLDIGWDSGSRDPSVTPTAVVTLPELRAIELDGASEATVDGLESDRFDVDLNGASEARVTGTVDRLVIDANGAASYHHDGAADEVVLDLNGASSVDLDDTVVGTATVDLNGASSAGFDRVDRVSGELNGASQIDVPSSADISVDSSGGSSIDRS